jgi:prolyl-tRNA synthetase
MVHGDDNGLVLPPRVAPIQVRIIPIKQNEEIVLNKVLEIKELLEKADIRVDIDFTDKSNGYKFHSSPGR